MTNRRNYADAYAETLVLPENNDALTTPGDDADPLALYEEYAREQTHEAMAGSPRPKR